MDLLKKASKAIKKTAGTVGHGVSSAAHSVGHGVTDVAHSVGHVVTDVAHRAADVVGDSDEDDPCGDLRVEFTSEMIDPVVYTGTSIRCEVVAKTGKLPDHPDDKSFIAIVPVRRLLSILFPFLSDRGVRQPRRDPLGAGAVRHPH